MTDPLPGGAFPDPRFVSLRMAELFSPAAHVRAMVRFEAALARAQARAGVIPPDAADAIISTAETVELDTAALYRDSARAGTLAIPLVKALSAAVPEPGRGYVHWGATSQDAIDTATVLQVRDALDLLVAELLMLADASARLAEEHRETLMPGRTLLQQALPLTFGLKAARWLTTAARHAERLRELRDRSLAVQFGGAAGTLASLGQDGLAVQEELAAALDLAVPDLPWHTERERLVEVAAAVGIVAGSMSKIAQDIVLMAQTEVGELAEATEEGKGGSSTLPHKRNPVDAMFALAAARLATGQVPVLLEAMTQDHERATGGWQTEWAALPALFMHAGAAVERVARVIAGLDVDAARMRANLDLTRGMLLAESLSMTLGRHLGKQEAHHYVQGLVDRMRDGTQDLRDIVRADTELRGRIDEAELERALDPAAYLGVTDALIDRALAVHREVVSQLQG